MYKINEYENTVSAKEIYELLDEELKARIRELQFFDSDDEAYLELVVDAQIIVDIQDALSNEEVLTVEVRKEFGEPSAENTDGGIDIIFEFVIDRYDYSQTIEIVQFSPVFLSAAIDEPVKVIYD